jgi:uncharacterized protein (DUF433 family)
MRIPKLQEERLKRMARRLCRTASDTGALLVEEGLRRSEFAFLDFRDSCLGRQAYIQGSTLAVWEVVRLVRDYGGEVAAVAGHLAWSVARVQAALNYAAAFPEEIEIAISDAAAVRFEDVLRLVPQTERVAVPASGGEP